MTRPETTDPRPLLLHAADQAGAVIGGVTPEQAALPTPCADWDVALLTSHLLAVVRRVAVVASGGDALSVPGLLPGVPPAEWAPSYAEGVDRLRAAWADDAVLDRELRLPFGTFPGRLAAAAYTQELTVHAWDLARATGWTGRLDPELALASLEVARRVVPAGQRGGPVPFGPVVDVPEDADPYLRLAGWLGRPVPVGSPAAT
jgi:uncharacterized protein (TIGR03086 family)